MSDDSSIGTLTQGEIERLQAGLPDLSQWSESLLVPFLARKLKHAHVVWLNERWFLERGIDVAETSTRARAINWIRHQFGYLIPSDEYDADCFVGPSLTLFADRYGSNTGLFAHGGSGRVATVGRFQIKGVGVTPLVGRGVNRPHSHGCASLNVALREAIYSEVANAEFPHGAVPVIAILDTGLTFSSSGNKSAPSTRLRRAIIVRPAVIRPAHMQRAPAFLHSVTGYENIQADDVARVKEVIQNFAKCCASDEQSSVPDISLHFRRVVRQLTFGQVHRLYNGGYFPSNLSIDGALLDFGNMHAMSSWNNVQVLDQDAGFGRELQVVSSSIRSLEFHFTKYLPGSALTRSFAALKDLISGWCKQDWLKECMKLWQLEGERYAESLTVIGDHLLSYFREQQKSTINLTHGELPRNQWLDQALFNPQSNSSAYRALQFVQEALWIHFAARKDAQDRIKRCWWAAARLLKTRTGLIRAELQNNVNHLLLDTSTATHTLMQEKIGAFIRSTIDQNRRHWPNLPKSLTVLGHVSSDGFSALACSAGEEDRRFWWLEGIRCADALYFFSNRLSIHDFEGTPIEFRGMYWSTLVPMGDFGSQGIVLGNHNLQVPPLSVIYEPPNDYWISRKVGPQMDGIRTSVRALGTHE